MKKIFVFFLILLVTIAGLFFIGYKFFEPNLSTASNTKLSFNKSAKIQNDAGVTNILIFGVDTREEGYLNTGTLTDSIILVSVNKTSNTAKLLSIPRDTWVSYNGGGSKINEVYSVSGVESLQEVVENLLGVNIHYYAKVDFRTAVEFIDSLGGIEVNNPVAFTDYKYPKFGWENETCGIDVEELQKQKEEEDEIISEDDFPCRFETISFDEGLILLDGETTLKYARSRHSLDSNQGNDFARARRQHLVIDGVRGRLISAQILSNVPKLKELYSVFEDSIESDFGINDLIVGLGYFGDLRNYDIESAVLSDNVDEAGGVLVRGDPDLYNGLYVLVPRNSDSIQSFVNSFIYSPTE